MTARVDTLEQIDFPKLKAEGIKLLIFDYDDTLSGQSEPLSEETQKFLKLLSEASADPLRSFHLTILSNRPMSHDQVSLILDDTVLYFKIGEHQKPHPEAFLPILREHNVAPNEVAMIGDRGGTDMWGAYRLGFRERILITPFSDKTGKYYPPRLFQIIRARENARL